MKEYRTVAGYGRDQFEEKRSVFIGSADFVTTESEALAFIERIRAEFPDARHNVYAYLLREGAKTRYSDDREPQGTAGMPVLEVMRKNGCLDTVVVVTRYFGGILLGAGGLARAYTEAAALALAAAGAVLRRPAESYVFSCSYGEYERLCRVIEHAGGVLSTPSFSSDVLVSFSAGMAEAERICGQIFDASGGRINPKKTGEHWQNIAI